MKKQAGFTLIELVMVIVILGVLSAVALPKFVNLGADARGAAMKAVDGSMRSTNSMIYAKAAVNNLMGAGASITAVMVPGGPITADYGFAKTTTDLVKVMDLGADFDSTTTVGVISHKGAATPANCSVTYTAATGVTVPPTYVVNITGC
jgi:MSHA pilin protein MshA